MLEIFLINFKINYQLNLFTSRNLTVRRRRLITFKLTTVVIFYEMYYYKMYANAGMRFDFVKLIICCNMFIKPC